MMMMSSYRRIFARAFSRLSIFFFDKWGAKEKRSD